MDLCQAIFYRLTSIISSKSSHMKLAMMWTVIRAKRGENIILYVWYVNLDFGEFFVVYD